MIISPIGKIYVGSTSRTLKKRWQDYKELNCKRQIHLYSSFIKYGVEKHVFQKLWEGDVNEMYKQEYEFGQFYKVLERDFGLNCQLPKQSDVYSCISTETRQKMSNSAKNKPKISEETKLKMAIGIKKAFTEERKKRQSEIAKKRVLSKESKEKISKKHLGKKLSEEHKLKISTAKKGKKGNVGYIHTETTKLKISLAKQNKPQSVNHILSLSSSRKKPIIQMDLEGNFIKEWDSAIDIMLILGIHKSTISRCCTEKIKQTNNFKFKYKNKKK